MGEGCLGQEQAGWGEMNEQLSESLENSNTPIRLIGNLLFKIR